MEEGKKGSRPIRLIVSGCCGRMGSLIVEQAAREPDRFDLIGGVEQEGHPQIGRSLSAHPTAKITGDLRALLSHADLVIEFSTPEASVAHAEVAAEMNVPMVIGTTGFSADQQGHLRDLSRRIPIFWSPNMSLGILLLRRIIPSIFEVLKRCDLNDSARVAVSEIHHTQKKDAPSGTAKQLKEDLLKASGKPSSEIPIRWERKGDVVGMHTVELDLGAERITLRHEATDRRLFARGALLVAQAFHGMATQPGWYGMDELTTLISL
jgi:4-hydroxy-tetrahydrodipicolinate reductase